MIDEVRLEQEQPQQPESRRGRRSVILDPPPVKEQEDSFVLFFDQLEAPPRECNEFNEQQLHSICCNVAGSAKGDIGTQVALYIESILPKRLRGHRNPQPR